MAVQRLNPFPQPSVLENVTEGPAFVPHVRYRE
jgi:ABC-type polar amino acid transport system ATPase subunit